MIGTQRLPFAPARPFAGVTAWLGARPWSGIYAVALAWVLMPAIRRLFDWRAGGFTSLSVLSLVPLLALIPALVALTYGGRLQYVDRRLLICAWVWTGGFTYSLIVAFANGVNPAGAVYAYLQFMLPMAFGLWVASLKTPRAELYDRTAGFLLALSMPICLYAAYQFIAPPPWDVSWMRAVNVLSIGHPFPYQLRPFSTLNGPGILADFLDVTIALNLPRLLTARSPLRLLQFSLCVGTLALTMVRTGWLGFAVAILTYILLTPNRTRNLMAFAGVAAVCSLLILNFPTLLGDAKAGSDVANRFASLTQLDNDYSFMDRQRYFGGLLDEALQEPLGTGLGVVGTAAKLGDAGQAKDFDNGFIARLTEMGYFGAACYLVAVAAIFALAMARWRTYRLGGASAAPAIAVSVVSIQAMLFAMDLSADHHNALAGIAFWLSAAFLAERRG
jgi:putative inorganic carbon (HCO3(-)) transporter